MTRWKLVGWIAAASILVGLSIPWFLWGDRTTVAGVPLWVWWHAAWLLLAAIVFRLFVRSAWGLGIDRSDGSGSVASAGPSTGSESNTGGPGGEGP